MSRGNALGEDLSAIRDEDWISSAATISLVRRATLSPTAHVALSKRAHAGLLRARAALMVINNNQRHPDCDVPSGFWWAEGGASLTQRWELGDFETWIDKRVKYQIFGVRFFREDVDLILNASNVASKAVDPQPQKDRGGRSLSELWPDWVGELALYIHSEGIPPGEGTKGLDAVISAIEGRLAERGLTAPSRSTVQPAVKSVLLRMRSAGN